MGTNPNFPPKDAPSVDLPLDASTSLPEGAPAKPPVSEDESDSRPFDPEKFGEFTMPLDYLREVLSEPLPRAKDEDLLQETIPPHAKVEARAKAAKREEFATRPDAPQAKPKRENPPVEDTRTKGTKGAVLLGAIVISLAGLGGIAALVLPSDPPSKPEVVSPGVPTRDGGGERAKEVERVSREASAPQSMAPTTNAPEQKPISSSKATEEKGDAPKPQIGTSTKPEKKIAEPPQPPSPRPEDSNDPKWHPIYD